MRSVTVFRINIDTTSERFLNEVGSGGNVLCRTFVSIHKTDFPHPDFLDFPVIVLGWWLENYILMEDSGGEVDNTFMNGPFGFLSVWHTETLDFHLYQRQISGNETVASFSGISTEDYRSQLVTASRNLINALEELHYSNDDLMALSRLLVQVDRK